MFAEGTHAETFELGMAIRKEVLGADHVERSLARSSEFARPIQEYVTEFCWGGIWSRDGLEHAERSLVNIGILTALNRSHELGVHVRGAIRNGVTVKQVQEVLLQSFRVAEAVLRAELGDEVVDGVAADGRSA
jgi:4-carboxymuconolactone decarboxylase